MNTATDISIRKTAGGTVFKGSATAWRDGVAGMDMQGRFSATVEWLWAVEGAAHLSRYSLRATDSPPTLLFFDGTEKTARKVLREYLKSVGQLDTELLTEYLKAVAILSE